MAPSELFLILSRIKSHLFGVVRVVDVIDVVRGVHVDVDAFDAAGNINLVDAVGSVVFVHIVNAFVVAGERCTCCECY